MDWPSKLTMDYKPADFHLFDLAGTPITAATLVVFVLIVGLTFLLSRLILLVERSTKPGDVLQVDVHFDAPVVETLRRAV